MEDQLQVLASVDESENLSDRNRTPPGTKCPHGVYIPFGDLVATYCAVCNQSFAL